MKIPNQLKTISGKEIKTKEEWESLGRNEALCLLSEYEYGFFPKAKIIGDDAQTEYIDENYIGGKAILKRTKYTVKYAFGEYSFPIWLVTPKKTENPKKIPTFIYIMLQGSQSEKYDIEKTAAMPFLPLSEITARGFAVCVYKVCDFANDSSESVQNTKLHKFFADNGYEFTDNSFSTIGAWSYGAMRCADYIINKEQNCDKSRLMLAGHSRGGKTALWAGANDERFSLVYSNDAGCSGDALSRANTGETVASINQNFPHWFCKNYRKFGSDVEALPFDQHYLLSLIAPRKLCIGSAAHDAWACPENQLKSARLAGRVYSLYGMRGVPPFKRAILGKHYDSDGISYHLSDAAHGLALSDWICCMDAADGNVTKFD